MTREKGGNAEQENANEKGKKGKKAGKKKKKSKGNILTESSTMPIEMK